MSHLNLRDPQTVREKLVSWLGERHPELGEIAMPPPLVPASGGSGETFLVSAITRKSGMDLARQWVLRIEPTKYPVYKDPSAEREFRVLDILSQAGVPVPAPLWYEADPEVMGAPFFLMERVTGEAPHGMHHSQGILADSSPAAREAMWSSAIEALAKIHRVNDERLLFLARPDLGPTGLDEEITYWTDYMRWTGAEIRPSQDQALLWLHDHLPCERGTGLAWGDARPGNMLFHDNACRAAIDWEAVSLGSPETDLGWWIFYDWFVAEGAQVPRLEGFGDRDLTIRTWEQLCGRKAQAMEWHEVFATFKFGLILDRAKVLAQRVNRQDVVEAMPDALLEKRLQHLIAA